MKFTTSIAAVAAIVAPAFAAPAGDLTKRDTCTLTAVFTKGTVIGSGGPGQVPVFTSDNFFTFQRPGSDVFRINGNSIQSGWQTIPSSSTGTAMDVSFYSAFDLSSWNPCKTIQSGHQTLPASYPVSAQATGHYSDSSGSACRRRIASYSYHEPPDVPAGRQGEEDYEDIGTCCANCTMAFER
ncbi:hypothetical protein C1H76_5721 [Elsinoe australis]|uniref:Uncharacterized protein n=1 Tax=Elsinoe australis TaxID=40998 RepID=A0A4U7AUG9_9PEZI|nr:hypothetical protein C1H76_5721 [Elsinoe australis]